MCAGLVEGSKQPDVRIQGRVRPLATMDENLAQKRKDYVRLRSELQLGVR
jgi:hypothetical protein